MLSSIHRTLGPISSLASSLCIAAALTITCAISYSTELGNTIDRWNTAKQFRTLSFPTITVAKWGLNVSCTTDPSGSQENRRELSKLLRRLSTVRINRFMQSYEFTISMLAFRSFVYAVVYYVRCANKTTSIARFPHSTLPRLTSEMSRSHRLPHSRVAIYRPCLLCLSEPFLDIGISSSNRIASWRQRHWCLNSWAFPNSCLSCCYCSSDHADVGTVLEGHADIVASSCISDEAPILSTRPLTTT